MYRTTVSCRATRGQKWINPKDFPDLILNCQTADPGRAYSTVGSLYIFVSARERLGHITLIQLANVLWRTTCDMSDQACSHALLEKVIQMNSRFLAVGALAMLAAHAANATVYFDSVNVTNPQSGFDGLSDGTSAMADSFTAPTQNFNQISLLLAAGTPSDGGSASVFLVPDNGTGSLGVAGSPTAAFSSGVFSSFTGAQLLGSIQDSSLATTGSGATLVSLAVSPAITSPNNEYWVGLVPGSGSSADWYFGSANDGLGVAGQSNFFANTAGGSTTQTNASLVGGGPYDLIVSTPEPASLSILGVGLAGIGYFRRRGTRQV
jgi:hypothetical protein